MPDGFEEFVVSTSPRLARTARMILGNGADAEDMAQETLIVLHQHWGRLRDRRAANAYAYKTLVRYTRRHRQRARFRRESTTTPAEMPTGATVDVADEREGGLAAALLDLPPRQREAVVLRYYLDLSIEDTAKAMRCSPGTVKSQTSKALSALRDAVKRQPTSGGQ